MKMPLTLPLALSTHNSSSRSFDSLNLINLTPHLPIENLRKAQSSQLLSGRVVVFLLWLDMRCCLYAGGMEEKEHKFIGS